MAAASAGMAKDLRVGHRVESIEVPGSEFQSRTRMVKVHLWYPADQQGLSEAPKSHYTPALHRDRLSTDEADKWERTVGARWDPLSWAIDAEIAREEAPIDPNGQSYPVIVFSHGSVNDPIDYAHTLELIAGAGFVVAAPYHVNNTQDDVRIDFINGEAARVIPGLRLFDCSDGRPSGSCSRPSVPLSMTDRLRDISKVLDALPGWFGDRVDASQVGVLGHSRGTVTALAAAGGTAAWGPPPQEVGPARGLNCVPRVPGQPAPEFCWPAVRPEPRVRAIMGMAIGARPVTFGANVPNVTVPTLLVAGTLDETSPHAVSGEAFDGISSDEKAFVSIQNATHRSFDSTYCDQTQASGAIAQGNPRAILDLHTARGILTAPTSGRATQYCSYATFTNPTDITPLVESLAGITVTQENVPSTGLGTDEVMHGVKELAVTFFGTVLKRVGNDGVHFTRYLAPKWLEKHEPMVGGAEAVASADAICPAGQQVVCED
jgi:predicted dienelactone hydrolase